MVNIERTEGPVTVNQEQGKRLGVVVANVTGHDLVGFVEEAKCKVVEELQLPTGYSLNGADNLKTRNVPQPIYLLLYPLPLG